MLMISWERKASGRLDLEQPHHGVLTRMTFFVARNVARCDFGSFFLQVILARTKTDVFNISRAHDLLPHFCFIIT